MAKQRRLGIGIDIGGTGIKGGLVDLDKGRLVGERCKVKTPSGAPIEPVLEAVTTVLDEIRAQKKAPAEPVPIGLCMPSIVVHGESRTAANIDAEWIGAPARTLFSTTIGQPVSLVNDADAAGIGEVRYGAAKGDTGSVMVITLGTGIGSALIHGGHLFPNTELGHLELDGHPDYERYASARAMEREGLDYPEWCERLTPYFRKLERLFAPDEFIISGGVSKRADEFLPLIDIDTPILAAKLKNNAGIVGAAALGADGWD